MRFSLEAVFKAIDQISAPVSKIQNRIGRFTRSVTRDLHAVNRHMDNLVGGIQSGAVRVAGFASVAMGGLTAATLGFIREASKIEDAVASFTPLLGGVTRAEELVAKLNQTAATTPFQFEDLAGTAKQLLPVMNGDIERTIKTLRMMGDTAGGNAQKLDSITRGFTKAMLKGKVDMESLNMIAEAGVPIFTELASAMGTKVNQAFFKMISAGEVGTRDLTRAFEKMTSTGGVFFRGMEIASETQSGLWSTLKDNVSLTAAAIGQQILPVSKQYTKQAIELTGRIREWVTANRDLIRQRVGDTVTFITGNLGNFLRVARGVVSIIGAIITVSLTLKAVMLSIAIATNIWVAAMFTLKALMMGFNVVMAVARVAMLAFNLAFAANPIGAIIIAVGLLIGLGVLLIRNWDDIVAAIRSAVSKIASLMEVVAMPFKDIIQGATAIFSSFRGLFGGGGGEDQAAAGGAPQIISPGDRTAQAIEERRQTSTAELTIRDETGRAELTKKNDVPGIGLDLMASGAF